ncbi:hypothetical protein BaRGS_00023902, partial [Batillaria attramentaria]
LIGGPLLSLNWFSYSGPIGLVEPFFRSAVTYIATLPCGEFQVELSESGCAVTVRAMCLSGQFLAVVLKSPLCVVKTLPAASAYFQYLTLWTVTLVDCILTLWTVTLWTVFDAVDCGALDCVLTPWTVFDAVDCGAMDCV